MSVSHILNPITNKILPVYLPAASTGGVTAVQCNDGTLTATEDSGTVTLSGAGSLWYQFQPASDVDFNGKNLTNVGLIQTTGIDFDTIDCQSLTAQNSITTPALTVTLINNKQPGLLTNLVCSDGSCVITPNAGGNVLTISQCGVNQGNAVVDILNHAVPTITAPQATTPFQILQINPDAITNSLYFRLNISSLPFQVESLGSAQSGLSLRLYLAPTNTTAYSASTISILCTGVSSGSILNVQSFGSLLTLGIESSQSSIYLMGQWVSAPTASLQLASGSLSGVLECLKFNSSTW